MKRTRIIKWLILSEEQALSGRRERKLQQALSASEDLRDEKERLQKLSALLADQAPRFRPGFTARTLQRISAQETWMKPQDVFQDITPVFRRIALAAAAVFLLLLLSYYFTGGGLSLDSMFGIDHFSDESLISYLLYQQ